MITPLNGSKTLWDYIDYIWILCTVHILGTTRQTSLTLSNRQVSISSFMFMAYIREFEYNFLMGWRAQDIFQNGDWKKWWWYRKETIAWFLWVILYQGIEYLVRFRTSIINMQLHIFVFRHTQNFAILRTNKH